MKDGDLCILTVNGTWAPFGGVYSHQILEKGTVVIVVRQYPLRTSISYYTKDSIVFCKGHTFLINNSILKAIS